LENTEQKAVSNFFSKRERVVDKNLKAGIYDGKDFQAR